MLLQNPGRVFTRLELLDRVQGDAYEGYERTVDAHIKNLRAKLGDDPAIRTTSRRCSAWATSWEPTVNRLWVKLTPGIPGDIAGGHRGGGRDASRATGEQFRQYVVASGMAGQPAWAQTLAEYYAAHGSWDGVDKMLAQLGPGGMGMGRGRGARAIAGPNLAVADTAGRVLASKTGEVVGELLPASVLAQGLPLALDGQPIGTLLNVRPADVVLDAQGQAFLRQVQTSLVWAALLAGALVVGARRAGQPLADRAAGAPDACRTSRGRRRPIPDA